MSVFQIALIDCVPSGAADYFNYSAKNIITYTLWEHLIGVARGSSQKSRDNIRFMSANLFRTVRQYTGAM
jgi:hypothetical protein